MLYMNKKSIQKIGIALVLSGMMACGGIAMTAAPVAHAATKETILSRQEALDIAQKKVKGTLLKTELDEDDGRLIYEIEILNASNTKYDMDIDALSGKILKTKTIKYKKQKAEKLRSAKISHNKAIEAAKKDTGASTLILCELDIENGKLIYELDLRDGKRTEYEVIVDAATGKVLFSDMDYDD